MNSQFKRMIPQNDRNEEIENFIDLMYQCGFEESKMDENKANSVPNYFLHAAGQPHQSHRTLPPQSHRRLPPNNVLRDISNNVNPKHRMIRGDSELSKPFFSNNGPSSLTSPGYNIMKLPFLPGIQNRNDIENTLPRNLSLFTNHEGMIQVSLGNGISIDITIDNSIRLTSCAGQIVVSLSQTGDISAIKHPNGCVQQFGKFVQIIANGGTNNSTRYANMCSNGIHFTTSSFGEVFLLDSIGTRSTKEYFAKLSGDNTSSVFLGKARFGSRYNDEILNIIQQATYKKNIEDDTKVISINDYRIWQMRDGLVTVVRISCPFKIRISPKNGSLTLSTPSIHCTASSRDSSHLFVRCQDQSMHFDGSNFVVRYNGNSAGFDEHDFLIVY